MIDGDFELLWDTEGELTESPVWRADERRIYFLANNGEAGAICAYGVDDGSRQRWPMPDRVASFGSCRSGRLVIALRRQVMLFDPATGELTSLGAELDEPAGNKYNDGRPGPDGCYWVGTGDGRRRLQLGTSYKVEDPNGGLYRITPDGVATRMMTGILSANGMAFAPDAATLYFGDSANSYVDAWNFDAGSGRIEARRRFLTLSPAIGNPDGAAVDSTGNYWSAGITAARINRFSPEGELLDFWATPCPRPTMPCFADGHLYLTSMAGIHPDADAASGLQAQRQLPHPVAGLFRARTDVRGAEVGQFSDR